MITRRSRYLRHRFPPDIISHAVWLCHRYCLSFRDIEDLLAARGIIVSYETVRQWCRKFGPDFPMPPSPILAVTEYGPRVVPGWSGISQFTGTRSCSSCSQLRTTWICPDAPVGSFSTIRSRSLCGLTEKFALVFSPMGWSANAP